jgi:hypothetical protein
MMDDIASRQQRIARDKKTPLPLTAHYCGMIDNTSLPAA